MNARFTEEQIIRILKEHEGGKKAADIVREYNYNNLSRRSTAGRANTAVWTLTRPKG